MEQISIKEAQIKTSPNSISVICAETATKTTNLAPISWWTYLSNNPPMLGFAISKKSLTGELILENHRAALCIPGEEIADQVFQCGCISGRTVNKVEEFDISLVEIEEMNIKVPDHCKLVFLCNTEETVDVGDHKFFICKIDKIYFNPNKSQLFAWDGYAKLATL